MKMQYFIAIIEIDTEKLDTWTGRIIVSQMTELKEIISKHGECAYYQVTDVAALKRFKADIKRLNP